MRIEGEYAAFAHLETLYLGALSEGTRVATNTRDVVAAANGKPVIMFGARHQGHETQAGSGYAAYVGGAIGHLTAKGTPEGHVNVTSLVDFNNDVVNTSLGVAHALGARLWGVRVDTSESLVDRAILRELEENDGVAG